MTELKAEQHHQAEYAERNVVAPTDRKNKLPSGSIYKLYNIPLRYDTEIRKYGKFRWFTRVKAFFSGLAISNRDEIERSIQIKEYRQTVSSIKSLKKDIISFEKSYQKYQKISLEYLKSYLANKYGTKKKRIVFDRKGPELTNSQDFLGHYPIVTRTIFPATSNIAPHIPFDYLIMDEASHYLRN